MTMRFLKKSAMVFSVSICAMLVAASASAGESCGGCEKMKSIAEKIRNVSLSDDQRVSELLDAATQAINTLPKTKGHLTPTQARELVALINQVTKVDKNQFVLQDTIDVIRTNKAEFDKAVHALPADDAKRVATYVAAVIEEQKSGND